MIDITQLHLASTSSNTHQSDNLPLLWLPQDELGLQAEVQNEFYLNIKRRKNAKPRPTSLNRNQIKACGLGDYLDDPRFLFVPLTQNLWSVIDVRDRDLAEFTWSPRKTDHATYVVRVVDGKPVHLHREVTACPDGLEVDHISGNTLNNSRENLRVASHSQNVAAGRRRPGPSGYVGVSWHLHNQKWRASITVRGQKIFLGYFDSPARAAAVYARAANRYFRAFSRMNGRAA